MKTIARFPTATRRLCAVRQWLPVVAWAAVIATGAAAQGPAATGRSHAASSKRPVVDPAVVPAGGNAHGPCGPGGCRHDHARHHRDCRNGVCAPYCPVRPSTFGFHGTQWRRWPGQAVVPVSNEQAVTPVTPPRLEVPKADEESLGPAPGDLPSPHDDQAPDDTPATAPLPETPAFPDEPAAPAQPPLAPEPELMPSEPTPPSAEPEPTAPMKEDEVTPAEPRELPRGDEQPAPATEPPLPTEPAPRPEDDNLFDQSRSRRVSRRIPVAVAAVQPDTAAVQATGHEAADDAERENRFVPPATVPASQPPQASSMPSRRGWLAVPRVAFDPEAERSRLESSPRE